MNLIGLLLAAGRGRRMGGNKQFYPVRTPTGEKPLVSAAFETIAHACDAMIVVLGHRADEVAEAFGDLKFEIVTSDPDAPMFDSIKAGLQAALDPSRTRAPLRRSGRRSGNPAILLQLGDHPALERTTLGKLLTIAAENPGKAVMPTFKDNGGHPVVIPASVAEKILTSPYPGGLRQFWLDHPDLCLRVPVNDPGVTLNINVP
jgi:molybdenum cofactor cytidylyltransferase